MARRDGLFGLRPHPSGRPGGRSPPLRGVVEPGLFSVGGSNGRRQTMVTGRWFSDRVKMAPRDGLLGASRLAPPGAPCGRSPSPLRGAVVEPACFLSAVRIDAVERPI